MKASREGSATLSYSRWTIADLSWPHKRRKATRANRLLRSPGRGAAWLAKTPGTASQTIIALERKGYMARSAGPRDKRARRLDVTEAGAAMLKRSAAVLRLPGCRFYDFAADGASGHRASFDAPVDADEATRACMAHQGE